MTTHSRATGGPEAALDGTAFATSFRAVRHVLASLLFISNLACSIDDGLELVSPPPSPGAVQKPVRAGWLLFNSEEAPIGHLVLDADLEGALLLNDRLFVVRGRTAGDRLVFYDFERVEFDEVNLQVENMVVDWTGEAFGNGVARVSGSSIFCDVDYCLEPRTFSDSVTVRPADRDGTMRLVRGARDAPGLSFPSDAIGVRFDRMIERDAVRSNLTVLANDVEISGTVSPVGDAGPWIVAARFVPSEALPFSATLRVEMPGVAAASSRVVDDPGPLLVGGALDMTHWAVSTPDGFADRFNCLTPAEGPLLVLRAGFDRADRAYAYLDAAGDNSFALDVMSFSSWVTEPSMARIFVDDRIVYEHGGPLLHGNPTCAHGPDAEDPFESASGGGTVRIDLGADRSRVHVTVETATRELSPAAAIVIGQFAP